MNADIAKGREGLVDQIYGMPPRRVRALLDAAFEMLAEVEAEAAAADNVIDREFFRGVRAGIIDCVNICQSRLGAEPN